MMEGLSDCGVEGEEGGHGCCWMRHWVERRTVRVESLEVIKGEKEVIFQRKSTNARAISLVLDAGS